MLANSLAVTNSVIFSTLLSSISWFSNSCIRLETISRFSLRYLEALFFPFVVRRAKVSFTCLATSSSLTSCFTTGFLKRSLLLLLRLRFCPPPPCPAGFWLLGVGCAKLEATLLTSTFSLLIRIRFFFAFASAFSFGADFATLLSSLRISLIIASLICFL